MDGSQYAILTYEKSLKSVIFNNIEEAIRHVESQNPTPERIKENIYKDYNEHLIITQGNSSIELDLSDELKKELKKCRVCKKLTTNEKYCSRECYAERPRIDYDDIKPCEDCGNDFKINKWTRTRKYPNKCRKCSRLQIELNRELSEKSKFNRSKLYRKWSSMKELTSPNNSRYRGDTICHEWQDYDNFKRWALKNMEDEDSILRRKDDNKPFGPDNCYFTVKGKYEYKGELLTASDIYDDISEFDRVKVSKRTFRKRLKSGNFTIMEAAFTKSKNDNKRAKPFIKENKWKD